MPRRSKYRLPKLKLRQETVVGISSILAFIFAVLSLVSIIYPASFLIFWKDFLFQSMGWNALLSPFVFILVGLVLLKVKWKYGQLNVLVGFVTMMLTLMGLSSAVNTSSGGQTGTIIWEELSKLLSAPGTVALLIGVFFVGLIVLLNTSPSQVLAFLSSIFSAIFSGLSSVMGLTQRFNKDDFQSAHLGEMKVSGIDDIAAPRKPVAKPASGGGGKDVTSDNLVMSTAGQNGVWKYPPINLLSDKAGAPADRGDVKQNAKKIEGTLDSFGIAARVAEVNGGPAVTQYALEISAGTKITKVANLQHDIAMALATRTGTVRIEAPIPGKSLVGIEVPNQTLEVVTLKSVVASEEMKKHKSRLAVCLGKDTSSRPVVVDIDKMPHCLVAGTTGSGKSVLMHSLITSLLYRNSPDELKLILIDPKRVEMSNYNDVPHLLTPVIVEPDKILSALKWACAEMDRRYKLFQSVGVRNIQSYNEMSGFQALPYIVIFIDELADLMMFAPVEVEESITRIAQLARATGIHLVIATQRPSVDVITGLMKANIPCRIAFNVSSMIDSRVIIDGPGAEKLLGRGDMLFMPPDAAKPVRIQGVFLTDPEINTVVKFLKSQGIPPQFVEEITNMPVGQIKKGSGASMGGGGGGEDQDDLFEEAVKTVCQYDRASASLLQRRLRVGYARAARIIDELEMAGVIGPGEGSKPRDVLVRNADEYFAQQAGGAGPSSQGPDLY